MLPLALKAEHGDQQGADAEIWGREPVQVSGRSLGLTRHVTSSLFQGLDRQEDQGDRGSGAQLRQLEPAAAEGAVGRVELQRGGEK